MNDVKPLKFITSQCVDTHFKRIVNKKKNINNNNTNKLICDKSTNDTNFCQVIEIKKVKWHWTLFENFSLK